MCREPSAQGPLLRDIRREIEGRLPVGHEAFWYRPTDDDDAVILPMRKESIPAVLDDLSEAASHGFPPWAMYACAAGLVIAGVTEASLGQWSKMP